jgi:hypothetical protein
MPTNTYTPLATVSLASTASSVTFSSIPATYRDLIIVVTGTTSVNQGALVRFNGDSGNNSQVAMYGNGSSAASFAEANNSSLQMYTVQSQATIQVMDYSATDKHKTTLVRSGGQSSSTFAFATRWASTAAITSIALSTASGTFSSGSTFSLYGVIA